mmetsp:Transcript_32934/g.87365  ORF Transcript_32934/g.87365 Transcript_32934/m.87365 type:complete len:125 (-) Transcript_32934:768-1142(-)
MTGESVKKVRILIVVGRRLEIRQRSHGAQHHNGRHTGECVPCGWQYFGGWRISPNLWGPCHQEWRQGSLGCECVRLSGRRETEDGVREPERKPPATMKVETILTPVNGKTQGNRAQGLQAQSSG